MRSPFQSYHWSSNIFSCESSDLIQCQTLLNEEAQRLTMQRCVLGDIASNELVIYKSPAPNSDLPSILICAGFYGEEPAGPWGIIHFLNQISPDIFEHVNLTVLPLVNYSGFRKGYRYNQLGLDPNRGFHWLNGSAKGESGISAEAELLMKNTQILQAASKHGVLSCHEDIQQKKAYICAFEPSQMPSKFSLHLLQSLGEFFPVTDDIEINGRELTHGVIFNCFDSSFESFLVRSGSRLAICSETPATYNFDTRVLANSSVIKHFVKYYIEDEFKNKIFIDDK